MSKCKYKLNLNEWVVIILSHLPLISILMVELWMLQKVMVLKRSSSGFIFSSPLLPSGCFPFSENHSIYQLNLLQKYDITFRGSG